MFRTARFALVLLCSALAGAQDDSLAGSFLSGMSPHLKSAPTVPAFTVIPVKFPPNMRTAPVREATLALL